MELKFSNFQLNRTLYIVQCCARKTAPTFFMKKWQLCQNLRLFNSTQRTKPPRLPIRSSSRYLEVNVCPRNSDGKAGGNSGVDHRRRMGHDAATLQVAEAVHECTHGPLHTCGHGEGDEAQSWAQNSAVAGVTAGAALEAQWHKWAAWWIGRAGCLGCHIVHGAKMNCSRRNKSYRRTVAQTPQTPLGIDRKCKMQGQ